MPRIIEGRRRGRGVGTAGVLLGGYQRRDNEDKPYWPEPAQATSPNQEQQEGFAGQSSITTAHPSPSSLLTQAEDEEEKEAMLEAAKRAFEKRRPRKKKKPSSFYSMDDDDDGFSFGGKRKRKPNLPKSSSTPPVSTTNNRDRGHHHMPLITPAGSVVSLAEQGETSRQSPLSWQSPHVHVPHHHQSAQNVHQKELEALKEQHRLQMEQQIRKHKAEMETQIQKHNANVQELHTTIEDLQQKHGAKDEQHSKAIQEAVEQTRKGKDEQHAIALKEKDEQHAKAIKEAVERTRKEKDEQHAKALKEKDEKHSKALKEAAENQQAKNATIEKAKDEEHRKVLKEAVELERERITFLWDEDKRNNHLQITSLQQELEAYQKGAKSQSATNLLSPDNQRQEVEKKKQEEAAQKERDRKLAVLKEASTYFSRNEPILSPPFIHRFPLLGRLTMAQMDAQTQRSTLLSLHPVRIQPSPPENPFRSSARTFELSTTMKLDSDPKSEDGSTFQSIDSAAAVLLELNNDTMPKPAKDPTNLPKAKAKESPEAAKPATVAKESDNKGKPTTTSSTENGKEAKGATSSLTDNAPSDSKSTHSKATTNKSEKNGMNSEKEIGSSYPPLNIKKVPRAKSPPPSRPSPRKITAARASPLRRISPRKRLQDVLPSFHIPHGLIADTSSKKRRSKRTKVA